MIEIEREIVDLQGFTMRTGADISVHYLGRSISS